MNEAGTKCVYPAVGQSWPGWGWARLSVDVLRDDEHSERLMGDLCRGHPESAAVYKHSLSMSCDLTLFHSELFNQFSFWGGEVVSRPDCEAILTQAGVNHKPGVRPGNGWLVNPEMAARWGLQVCPFGHCLTA